MALPFWLNSLDLGFVCVEKALSGSQPRLPAPGPCPCVLPPAALLTSGVLPLGSRHRAPWPRSRAGWLWTGPHQWVLGGRWPRTGPHLVPPRLGASRPLDGRSRPGRRSGSAESDSLSFRHLFREADQRRVSARGCCRRRSAQVARLNVVAKPKLRHTWPSTSITDMGVDDKSIVFVPLQRRHFGKLPQEVLQSAQIREDGREPGSFSLRSSIESPCMEVCFTLSSWL